MPAENATAHAPSYFLISVSTRENLELCIKYGLAGFPSGESGAWTYCEIAEGDFVSFLYGARAYNLYKVVEKEAISNSDRLPPWKPLTFKESGKTYSFPFRLQLHPVRLFTELLVRAEFYYVAENLLLRGGYRKTHFQADQTTLQSVSEMGTPTISSVAPLPLPAHDLFTLRFTRNSKLTKTPEICRFQETILQSAVRRHLSTEQNLQSLLVGLGVTGIEASAMEILGEKALMQGHIDLLLKDRVPLGSARKIPMEVKTNQAQPKDLVQLNGYMDELTGECPIGILIASDFSKSTISKAQEMKVRLIRYSMMSDMKKTPTFEEIYGGLVLEPLPE